MAGDLAAVDDDIAAAGLHHNELIPAIQEEEPFYDDEYDDLYNDVNVGDGFLHALHPRNRGTTQIEDEKPNYDSPPLPQPEAALTPAIAEEAITERTHLGLPSDRSGEAQGRAANSSIYGNEGFVSQAGVFANGKEGFSGQGGTFENEATPRQGINNGSGGGDGGGGAGGAGGLTTLFVGELHWWTTDADIEEELCKYGQVKDVRFFDEKVTGKSKGYCQVEFFDPVAAAACAEGMNGHVFNGRPCVAALASHYSIRKMGDEQVNRNRQQGAMGQLQQPADVAQKGRGGDGPPMNGNYGRGGGGGRGDCGRSGPMGSNRGPVGNMRNRMGPAGGRGIMGHGGIINPPLPVLHPGAMLGPGFDPAGFGTGMGRMCGGFGGFPAGPLGAPFPGMMPSFPPGVAPHGNPAFFGRSMPGGGVGMWQDTNMGGWRGDEQLGYGYGENSAPDQHYAEVNQDRGLNRHRSDVPNRRDDMEKENDHGQEWQDRRYRDEREVVCDRDREWERERKKERERGRGRGREKEREKVKEREREKEWERERERLKDRNRERDWDRDIHRDDRDMHDNHYRHRDRESERYDDWGRSSRAQIRSCEIEHAKRRRLSCD